MDKSSLRNMYLRLRAGLEGPSLDRESQLITARLKELVDWSTVKKVHVYESNAKWREVDTGWIVEYLASDWPHIDVTVGQNTEHPPLPQDTYELIIAPIVAFDEDCYRLGMGGGWYDRFLATQPTAVSIGLAYDSQELASVPAEPHDIPLTVVITPTRTFSS